MFAVKIEGKVYEAPQSIFEISISRYNEFLTMRMKHEPKEPLKWKKEEFTGFFWWFKQLFFNPLLSVDSDPELVMKWDSFHRKEVGFWYRIQESVLVRIEQGLINKLHAHLGNAYATPPKELAERKLDGSVKINGIGIKIAEDLTPLVEFNPRSDKPIQSILCQVCRDEDSKPLPITFFEVFPIGAAAQLLSYVRTAHNLNSTKSGRVIASWCFFQRTVFNN